MGLELKIIRVPELIFTFKNDVKLFITNISVAFAMLFTKGTNAIVIGLFLYLVMLAKELMMPLDELIYSNVKSENELKKEGVFHKEVSSLENSSNLSHLPQTNLPS